MPLPGPPPLKPYAFRSRWYVAAYSTFGSRGSIVRSVAPVNGSTYRTFVHVRPASLVLNTPRSGFSTQRFPTAATHATFGFVGCSTTRPIDRVSCRPRYVHESPPFVDR